MLIFAATVDRLSRHVGYLDTSAALKLLIEEPESSAVAEYLPDKPGVNFVDVTRADFLIAAALPGRLRSADALHLATALRLESDVLMIYDLEMAEAATLAGLSVSSPGID